MHKPGQLIDPVKDDKGKRRQRILLVVRWPVGGIRTFLRYVYSRFDPLKYKFTIVAPEVEELSTLLKDLSDLQIQCITVERRPRLNRFALVISREIFKGRYDLIHSHGLISGLCASVGALMTRTPHILTLHDLFLRKQFEGTSGRLKKLGISLALLQPDILHTVSNDARDNLLNFSSLKKPLKKKVVVIPHGIEALRFLKAESRDLRTELNLPKNLFLIGFFGRFMSPKGFKYLVDAIEVLHKRNDLPSKPIVIAVGEGGFQSREKRDIVRRGLEEHFIFMPFMPDISSVLKGLDVVAMPSIWEACGLLAMEALVAGVPLVSTSCMGLREVVNETPSRIVPPANSEALAGALIDEMKNSTKKNSIQYTSYASMRFDVQKESERLKNLYESFGIKQ